MDVLVSTVLSSLEIRSFTRSYRSGPKYDNRGTFFNSYEILQYFKFQPKLTDASNIGDAVAFGPLTWSTGSTIA
jgi:hypothetical protein